MSMVRRRVRQLTEGRGQVHDEERSERQSVVVDGLVCADDEKIKKNRKFTINNLEFSQVSRTAIYEVITVKLGYRKLCVRWVPTIVFERHKKQRMRSALDFLTRL